jgi:hypothetical protein
MSGGTRIIAFDAASTHAADDEILLTEEASGTALIAAADWDMPDPAGDWHAEEAEIDDDSDDDDHAAEGAGAEWLGPAFAGVLLAAWTAFYGWAMQDRLLGGATPGEWIALIRDWAVPVVLIGLVMIGFLRNSRREARRFGATARLLSDESARLELRLSTVNRELSLAREFIAAQSRDLETLGRLAADKLSTEADRLQGLIRDNHARVEAIGTVSSAALDNMEKLRGQLPVIASSAKDVTNNIASAGRGAHDQLQELIAGFRQLTEFGQASERQVQSLRGRVDETIAEFTRQTDQFGEMADARFTAFRETGSAFRTQLESHEVEALAAVRNRASVMAEELEQTRYRLDQTEAEGLTSMRARLSALREEGAAISRALREGEDRALDGWQAGVTRMKEELQSTLVALQEAESEAAEASKTRIAAIGDELATLERQALERAWRFTAESEKRQGEIAAVEESAATRMRDHIAALDEIAASRRERLGEVDRTAAESLRQSLIVVDGEITARRTAHDRFAHDASEQLRSSFAALDEDMAHRRAQHEAQGRAIVAQADAIAAQLIQFESRVAEIVAHGGEAETSLGAGLRTLAERLAESRSALTGTGGEIATLTDGSVRLLELIQASVKHSTQDLPQALARGDAQLSDIEARMAALRDAAGEADARGTRLAGTIDGASGALRRAYAELTQLQAGLDEAGSAHAQTLAGLRGDLDAISGQSGAFAEDTRARLAALLDDMAQTARTTIAGFSESGAIAVTALARQLGVDSAAAIEQAMRLSAGETAGQLEQSVAQAAAVSREATVQLRDQLARVNELAGNLEARVAHARERAEEQVDNDFSRRVALITESLNSNAIDIAKALSTDVADTAWAAYLRGDRGIFTRRAVSLVDNAEAKAIAQIYQRDREFHDHVSRYIHDFEAMLRQVLSARDGQALSVTLLSSDMGKLYVALAQAIERLRS